MRVINLVRPTNIFFLFMTKCVAKTATLIILEACSWMLLMMIMMA